MNDAIAQLMTYIRGAWRYRWYIHLIAWPVCIAGWLFVHYLPDQYEASTRVRVDTDSVLAPLLQGLAVRVDVKQQIRMMTRTLKSRPNLEKVLAMTDYDINLKTPEEEEKAINRLDKLIDISGNAKQNLYTITYVNKDPQQAKKVVESLLTIFVETTLGDSRKDTDSAQVFLNNQIAEYEQRLLAAEDRLKEFKRKNVGTMPTEGKGYYQRLQEETSILEQAKLALREETNRRDELKRQQLGEEPTFGIMPEVVQQRENLLNSALTLRINGLQSKLDELSLVYTDTHPDVVAIKRKIRILQEERSKELAGLPDTTRLQSASNINANPVYQRLKIALGEAEASVAALEVRVREYQRRTNNLKNKVDTIPRVEAELARLNRDYKVNQTNYETLVARRESAKISEQAQQSSDTVKFKVIDPPRVPLSPVGPNRLLLNTAVLIGSLVIGCFFAVFLSQIKPTFEHRSTVMEVVGLPVLGSVSMVWSQRQRVKNKIEAISFGLVFVILILIYGANIAFQLDPTNLTGTSL